MGEAAGGGVSGLVQSDPSRPAWAAGAGCGSPVGDNGSRNTTLPSTSDLGGTGGSEDGTGRGSEEGTGWGDGLEWAERERLS